MPKRDSASKPFSSTSAPSPNEGSSYAACALCGEPMADPTAGRLHIATSPRDRTYSAHAKCIHEKGMMTAAMRGSSSS